MKALNKYTLKFNKPELEELYIRAQYNKIFYSLVALTCFRLAIFLLVVILVIVYWNLPAI
jgi:hypothetical protein